MSDAPSIPDPAAPPQPPRLAPPTSPGPIGHGPDPSRWPTVIGVIAIVFGALGSLGSCLNLFQPLFITTMERMMPANMQWQVQVTRAWMPATMVVAAVSVLLAVLLLIAGILLVRRRRAALPLSLTWAILKMIAVVAATWVGHLVQIDMTKAMEASGQLPPGGTTMMQAFGKVGLAIGIAWGWALPVFILIWITRPAIRREVRTWP